MAEINRLTEKLKLKDFKLNALLEITKAINSNFGTPELLYQYENVLRQQLHIEKLILFTKDESWKCILKFGVQEIEIPDISDETFFSQKNEINLRQETFDLVIPVYQDGHPIAYLLVGDLQEEEIKISPVIKHMQFIQTLTNVLVVAIENKKFQLENIRQERINRELELAAEMQTILLPQHLPKNDFCEISAVYKAHLQVGGDYYDFMELNEDEVMFCMADVSGKGVSAAFLMANFQAYLRAIFTYSKSDLAQKVVELNDKVMKSALGEKYITLFLASYHKKTRILQYVNCGHNPPVLADSNGYTQLLKLGTIGLGMFEELPKLAMGEVKLAPNSTIICYTDGLVETENEQLQQFGVEKLEQIVLSNYELSAAELNKLILQSLIDYMGNMPYVDDLALLTCRFF